MRRVRIGRIRVGGGGWREKAVRQRKTNSVRGRAEVWRREVRRRRGRVSETGMKWIRYERGGIRVV